MLIAVISMTGSTFSNFYAQHPNKFYCYGDLMLTFEEYCEEPYFIAKLDEIIRSSMQAFASISQSVEDERNKVQTFASKREFPQIIAVDTLDS